MKLVAFLSILVLVSSCRDPVSDSKSKMQRKDSAFVGADTLSPEPSMAEVFGDLERDYHRIITIDTTFRINESLYKVTLTHKCILDSDLIIPGRLNFWTHEDFISHNFKSHLLIKKGNDTLANMIVEKGMFKQVLDTELDSFAILAYPHIKLDKKAIQLDYSISIPATDLGIGVRLILDTTGKFRIAE